MQTIKIAAVCAAGVIVTAVSTRPAASGGPPQLDVRMSCRAADRAFAYAGADKPRADMESCLEDERVARDTLIRTWASFSLQARGLCTGMNHTGGPASYVELLTCLEVMRDSGK